MTPQIAACLSADIPNLQEKELLSSLNNFKSGSFSSYQQDSNDKKRTKKFRLKRLFVNTIDYLSGKNKINTGALKLRFKLRKNAERKPKIVFFFPYGGVFCSKCSEEHAQKQNNRYLYLFLTIFLTKKIISKNDHIFCFIAIIIKKHIFTLRIKSESTLQQYN